MPLLPLAHLPRLTVQVCPGLKSSLWALRCRMPFSRVQYPLLCCCTIQRSALPQPKPRPPSLLLTISSPSHLFPQLDQQFPPSAFFLAFKPRLNLQCCRLMPRTFSSSQSSLARSIKGLSCLLCPASPNALPTLGLGLLVLCEAW